MSDALFDIPTAFGTDVAQAAADLAMYEQIGAVPVFSVQVYGTPAPQGSKKGFYNKALGRVQMVESSKKVKPWRDAVRLDALLQRGNAKPIDQAVLVDMVFTFTRPRSHYRTGRNAHLLSNSAPPRPSGMPDLDKLARSTGDSLKDAGVLADDSRIAEYGRLAKVWANEDRDSLDAPGCVIRIYLIGATS